MAVPYTFGTATAAIPLSQLDSNFSTTITIGNTAVQLGNTITAFANVSLVNATVTSLASPITAAQGGTGLATLTSNNVVLGNGTGNVLLVAPGTSGNVLVSNGTTWSSTTVSPAGGGTGLTTLTANNVILGNGTSNVQLVAPGTSGNVLTSNGTTWASTAAGGASAMTLISTKTASLSASLAWTGLSGYNNYLLIFDNLIPSANADLRVQLGTGSTTYITSGYIAQFAGNYYYGSNTAQTATYTGGTGFRVGNFSGVITTAASGFVSGSIFICGMNLGAPTQAFATGNTSDFVDTTFENGVYSGGLNDVNVKTAIKLFPNSGTFVSGTASLYGISS